MFRTIHLLCFFIACLGSGSLFAQRNRTQPDSTQSAGSLQPVSQPKNIIKLEPFGFLHGSIPVYFERRLSKSFSLELGAGATTGYNYLRQKGYNFWAIHKSASVRANYYPGSRNYRTSTIGYMFFLEPRYYFKRHAPSGFYSGLSLEYYRFRSTIPAASLVNNTISYTGPKGDEDDYEKDVRLNFGYQKTFKTLTLETYAGLGWQAISGKEYAVRIVNNMLYNARYEYSLYGFNYHLGLTVGYHFGNEKGLVKTTKKPKQKAADLAAVYPKKERIYPNSSNIIKIAPLGWFFTGVYPVLYERKLLPWASIQAGGGVTGRNNLRAFINTVGDELSIRYTYFPTFGGVQRDDARGPLNFEVRKATPGYLFTLQPRAYLSSHGLNGLFASVQYDYYRYNFHYPGVTAPYRFAGPPQKEHEIIQDKMAGLGYQHLFRHLSAEASVNIGFRSVRGTKYVASGTNEGFATYTDDGLNFGLGIKLGYHF